MTDLRTAPSLWFQRQGELSTRVALELTRARDRCIIRFTGGCGHMSAGDADGLPDLFADAFQGFGGAILFGGTRMVRRDDPTVVVPGITEVPARIRARCPKVITLGVVPTNGAFRVSPDHGLVVSDDARDPYVTIVHPDQTHCVVVLVADQHAAPWDAEYEECLRITEHVRSFAGWRSLLVSFNGGEVTERELLATAHRGWPVLLIEDSGRTTERYARDASFLRMHPNVRTAPRDADGIRRVLGELGVVPDAGSNRTIRLVRSA